MYTNLFLRSFLFEPDPGIADGGGAGTGGGAAPGASAPPVDPAIAPSFDFRTVINENGEFVEGWQDKLPADYDPHRKTLANYRDFGSLTKSFMDAKRAASMRTEGLLKVPVHPGENATKEQLDAFNAESAAFRKATGVPDSADGYELKAPASIPEGMEWNEDFAKGFAVEAHKLGLSKQQVQSLSAWHFNEIAKQDQTINTQGKAAYEAEMTKVRQAFGDNLDKRLMDAKRAALTLGLDPEKHPIFYRSDTIIAMAKLADMMGEDKLITTNQVQNKVGPLSTGKDVMTNPDNPDYRAYHDPMHPRHKEVVAFVNQQYQRAFPGNAK